MAQEFTNSGLTPNQQQQQPSGQGQSPQSPIGSYPVPSGRIFTAFNPATDVVSGRTEIFTRGLWTGDATTLSTYFTSSGMTTSQKAYYYEVYDGNPSLATSEPQMSVAYGHYRGSGSLGVNEDSPSKAIYYQYKQLLLPSTQTRFQFNSVSSNHIYVLNINRERFRDYLDPGNWEITLASLTGIATDRLNTGSNITISNTARLLKLIDDSGDTEQGATVIQNSYNVVSGSIAAGVISPKTYYGTVYPADGVIILNADALHTAVTGGFKFHTVTSSNVNGDNSFKLYRSLSASAARSATSHGFKARSAEMVASTYYWVRIYNAEYNFSNNPSFVSGSNGDFTQRTFQGDPKVYITGVGLYNSSQELMAVAKFSQPVLKSFENEATIKVKIDW